MCNTPNTKSIYSACVNVDMGTPWTCGILTNLIEKTMKKITMATGD